MLERAAAANINEQKIPNTNEILKKSDSMEKSKFYKDLVAYKKCETVQSCRNKRDLSLLRKLKEISKGRVNVIGISGKLKVKLKSYDASRSDLVNSQWSRKQSKSYDTPMTSYVGVASDISTVKGLKLTI